MKIDAQTFITQPCLIAADIDKTFLNHDCADEREKFIRELAPELLKTATFGTNIAVVTGNSIKEISTRFLSFLIKYLEANSAIKLLSKFHFFCNSGGVYIHINEADLLSARHGKVESMVFDAKNGDQIKSKYINKEFLDKTKISPEDINKIKDVLEDEWAEYVKDLKEHLESYNDEYYIHKEPKANCDAFKYPVDFALDGSDHVDCRYLMYEKDSQSTVQITMKPVLSWKHAINQESKFHNDKRTVLINGIHKRFDQLGLTNYVATAGGNSSIDITRSKLDKSYAIRFLIDHLGIEGNERKGEKYGSNVIYLGDEVISGGGNDFALTKIDGLLLLAVNKIPQYVPIRSRVIIPNDLTGPDASALVLSEFNNIIFRELKKWSNKKSEDNYPKKNGVQLFKEKWFRENILKKIDEIFTEKKLSTEELQVLYTFISLINRNDESAQKLTNLLVNELDEIMEALDENEYERFSGIGSN